MIKDLVNSIEASEPEKDASLHIFFNMPVPPHYDRAIEIHCYKSEDTEQANITFQCIADDSYSWNVCVLDNGVLFARFFGILPGVRAAIGFSSVQSFVDFWVNSETLPGDNVCFHNAPSGLRHPNRNYEFLAD